MKIALMIATIFLASTQVLAAPKMIIHCTGFSLPSGLKLSFVYVTDADNTGNSQSEIHAYEQASDSNEIRSSYFGRVICQSETRDENKIACSTDLSETFTVDLKNLTATASSDGFLAKYPDCQSF